jgi:hypothetical protein
MMVWRSKAKRRERGQDGRWDLKMLLSGRGYRLPAWRARQVVRLVIGDKLKIRQHHRLPGCNRVAIARFHPSRYKSKRLDQAA